MPSLKLDGRGRLLVPERNVQQACVELLRRLGWLVFETHTDARRSMGEAGQPDLVAVSVGVPAESTPSGYPICSVLLIEVKRSHGGGVRKAQKAWHANAKARGFRVLVIRDVDELRAELEAEY